MSKKPASKSAPKSKPSVTGLPKAGPGPEMTQKEVQDLISGLTSGEVLPKNEFAAYLVEGMKQTQETLKNMDQSIQQIQQQLTAHTERRQSLIGEYDKTIRDLVAWNRKL